MMPESNQPDVSERGSRLPDRDGSSTWGPDPSAMPRSETTNQHSRLLDAEERYASISTSDLIAFTEEELREREGESWDDTFVYALGLRLKSLEEQYEDAINQLGAESMRCEKAEGDRDKLKEQLKTLAGERDEAIELLKIGEALEGVMDWRGRALRAEEQYQASQEALSWALDVLEISLKRMDSIDGESLSPEHYAIREAGLAKARAALNPASRPEK